MNINTMGKNEDAQEQKIDDETKMSFEEKVNLFLLKMGRVPLKEKLFFIRNLEVMLKAGIPMTSALKTVSLQTKNKLFVYVLKDVCSNIEKGNSLSQSFKRHKKIFGDLTINMIESGEISGKLEEVLDKLYLQMKKQHELTSRVKGALTYPIVIVSAMFLIGIFMMAFVVPKITVIFKEYDAELPIMTRALIYISDMIANNIIIAVISLIVLISITIKVLNTNKGKLIFQALLFKMPIISPIIKKINLARFSRTMGSLLKTDIMIIRTFQITASILGNLHYQKALLEISEKIKKGGQINEALNDYPHLFPPIVIQMISVGEQTGELDNILEEIANFYEDEVNKTMENLPSIIEPLLILFLGVAVGVMAVALIMPMYSLTSTI